MFGIITVNTFKGLKVTTDIQYTRNNLIRNLDNKKETVTRRFRLRYFSRKGKQQPMQKNTKMK